MRSSWSPATRSRMTHCRTRRPGPRPASSARTLAAGLDLSATTHTDVGSYTDAWTFTDPAGNYNDASGTVDSEIAPAALTITADDATKTYGDTVTFAGTEFTAQRPARLGQRRQRHAHQRGRGADGHGRRQPVRDRRVGRRRDGPRELHDHLRRRRADRRTGRAHDHRRRPVQGVRRPVRLRRDRVLDDGSRQRRQRRLGHADQRRCCRRSRLRARTRSRSRPRSGPGSRTTRSPTFRARSRSATRRRSSATPP